MEKNKKIIPLRELNLSDRFLFDEVLEDPQTHQEVLSIIFGRDILLLDQTQSEKELRVFPLLRSIRMDVYSIDDEDVIYNTEMQQQKKNDLVRRSRYYQSMVDVSLLEPGVPDYSSLNSVYIIMIMTFDLFGNGKYMYTFKSRCEEVPECFLDDGAVRIFLNTKGQNKEEVSRELVEFLQYLENTTDAVAAKSGSERIRRIHQRVQKVRTSEEAGVRYMQAWEEKYYERQEGIAEGIEEGIRVIVQDYTEEGFDREKIVQKLQKHFDLSKEKADSYYERFLVEISDSTQKDL